MQCKASALWLGRTSPPTANVRLQCSRRGRDCSRLERVTPHMEVVRISCRQMLGSGLQIPPIERCRPSAAINVNANGRASARLAPNRMARYRFKWHKYALQAFAPSIAGTARLVPVLVGAGVAGSGAGVAVDVDAAGEGHALGGFALVDAGRVGLEVVAVGGVCVGGEAVVGVDQPLVAAAVAGAVPD